MITATGLAVEMGSWTGDPMADSMANQRAGQQVVWRALLVAAWWAMLLAAWKDFVKVAMTDVTLAAWKDAIRASH